MEEGEERERETESVSYVEYPLCVRTVDNDNDNEMFASMLSYFSSGMVI